jgi:hypothetical protein
MERFRTPMGLQDGGDRMHHERPQTHQNAGTGGVYKPTFHTPIFPSSQDPELRSTFKKPSKDLPCELGWLFVLSKVRTMPLMGLQVRSFTYAYTTYIH